MPQPRRAVYFFCADPAVDPVAGRVFLAAREEGMEEADFEIDGYPVERSVDGEGDQFSFVRTARVIAHDYGRYLPPMNRHFSGFDMAGLVTWHGGQNAPDGVLTVHTTGDAASGSFGPADPRRMRNLLASLERGRIREGLEDFRVSTEATHWSGIVCGGGDPGMIARFPVPLVDIEIGSAPLRWENEAAARVLARALREVFKDDGREMKNLLCAGGVHFEPAFALAALHSWDGHAFGVSHILANQWLVAGGYEGESGRLKLEACLGSIRGGVDGIVFHDNLKGAYKDALRALASERRLPVFKHQMLRRPEDIPWPMVDPALRKG